MPKSIGRERRLHSAEKRGTQRRLHPSFWKSLGYALEGIKVATQMERNFRIHLVATFIAIVLGLLLKVSPQEWLALILTIAFVLSLELLNSALESLSDEVSSDYSPLIKRAKDCAAGAVLIAALASLFIGGIIFLPKLLGLLS